MTRKQTVDGANVGRKTGRTLNPRRDRSECERDVGSGRKMSG
ncbi:hypothetical protein LptCag_1030 [Leptospirillum ferriphilum]|uniref:Uncharacterized protein n=1 Tax=Leptospirillum ferriphilum TaxID=178606 RepID=A0A094WF49_9BACT|nr:hypothetical protein LptCag_1030 [Leptospirillum ferriphilum]